MKKEASGVRVTRFRHKTDGVRALVATELPPRSLGLHDEGDYQEAGESHTSESGRTTKFPRPQCGTDAEQGQDGGDCQERSQRHQIARELIGPGRHADEPDRREDYKYHQPGAAAGEDDDAGHDKSPKSQDRHPYDTDREMVLAKQALHAL